MSGNQFSDLERVSLVLTTSNASALTKAVKSDVQCTCYCPSHVGIPPWECGLSSEQLDTMNKSIMQQVISRRKTASRPLSGLEPLCFDNDEDITAIRRIIRRKMLEKKQEEEKLDLLEERMLMLQYEVKTRTLSHR